MSGEASTIESPLATGDAVSERRESPSFVRDLIDVLERTAPDGSRPDRDRQRAVLANLPENLVGELQAQLYAAHLERRIYGEKRGRKAQPLNDRAVIAGRLFELLCENDPKINKNPADPVAQEILGVWQRPEMRGLEAALGGIRNSDAAMIEYTKEGRLVISGIGEAKAGFLDRRAYPQLKNFADSLNKLLEVLNGSNLRALGLEALARAREKYIQSVVAAHPKVKPEKFSGLAFIDVDPNLKQVLIVPADRKSDDLESFVSPELTRRDREDLLFGVMRRVEGPVESPKLVAKVAVARAAFSGRELHALVGHFTAQIPEVKD